MEEENTSNASQFTANPVISNTKAGFEPPHKKVILEDCLKIGRC